MKIKIKEKDQDALIRSLRIHWDPRSKQNVGDMIGFIDELLRQSSFGVFCYHYEGLGCPISITENKSYDKGYKEPFKTLEIEIEEKFDDQLTITKENGSQVNIWYGKYSLDSDLIMVIKERYKYYFNLGLKELEQS